MWVMVAATAFTVTLPVLASALIEEFDITRTQFGLLGLAGGLVAAAGSPFAGRVTDRIGGRNGVLVVLAGAAGAAVLFAGAPVFGAMFAGAGLAAVAGAAGNPATNKLIAQQLAPGRRGMVTGLKQTGPQVGSFLSGALAPWGAATIGWRPTVLVIGALMAAAVPLVLRLIPVEDGAHTRAERDRSPLTPGIGWVAVYGTLIGLGGSSTFLLPLFVEESLGQSPRVAGAAAALLGIVAIAGRFQWARIAERRAGPAPTMTLLAAGSIVAMGAMLISIEAGTAWMWLGTVILGLSASSWTAVAAISVIALAGPGGAGRASGIVWLGFLGGLGVGPPVYGFTVDQSGSYALMWWLSLAAFALAATVALAWMRDRRSDTSPAK